MFSKTSICNGLVRGISTFQDKGGLELEEFGDEKRAFQSAAKKVLPTLFKFVTDTHATVSKERKLEVNAMDIEGRDVDSGNSGEGLQKLKCVTEAISMFARLADRGLLEGLFKTVMQRLLEEIQSDCGDRERVCALLTLSQALVASQVLSEGSLSFLYRALKPLIRNDETPPRVQKRAYKVLHELCEKHPSFVTADTRLKELTALLTGTILTSQISARHMRLKCMNTIVDGLDSSPNSRIVSVDNPLSSHSNHSHLVQSELHEVVPEVLLCLKDFNAKTREASYGLLVTMASRGDTIEFVNVVLAALGAKTSHMRSAVVLALSRLVFEFGRENDQILSLLPKLLETVLLLINEGSREVVKSVVGFVRICVSALPPDELEPLVPGLLGALLGSQQAKSRFRAKIKIILKKLVKLFGYEALMESVPQSETRLLSHMRKLDEREKRKRISSREDTESRVGAFDDMVESDEDDSDDGMTYATGATGLLSRKSRRTKGTSALSKQSTQKSRSSAKDKVKNGIRLPDGDDQDVVDMLGPRVAKQVQFADEESSDDSSDGGALEFDDDGRIVVQDEDDTYLNDTTEAMEVPEKKRKLSAQTSNQSTTKSDKAAKKRKVGLGSSYKSSKAGGDVKRKDQKYEPYAYVPLDGRAFSKKNRRNAVEQMSTVVRGKGSKKRK